MAHAATRRIAAGTRQRVSWTQGLLPQSVLQVAACTAVLLSAGAGRAQEGTQPAPDAPRQPNPATQDPQTQGAMNVRTEGDQIFISFNESNGIDLLEFIKMTERMTGKVFTFNDTELATAQGQKITYVGTLPFPKATFRDEFFAFFGTMLYMKGFALVERAAGSAKMYEIVNVSGARQREITSGATYVTLENVERYAMQTGVTILTTVPLKHMNAQVAGNALRPFFATGGAGSAASLQIGTVGNNTALLLQGFGPQVYAAVQLMRLVDVPTDLPEMRIHVQRLEHAAPEEIEPLLNDILNDRGRLARQASSPEGGAPPGPAGQAGASGLAQLKIATHTGQRALILSGTPVQIREALELIAKLDVPPEPIDGQANVYRLKNVLAADLRSTLNEFVRQDQQAETQAQQPGSGGSTARRPRPTVIQAHEESNSLVISASATKYRQIHALIEQLDRRQPQVLIEAALVELTTGDLLNIGVELGMIDIKENGDYTRPFGFTSYGLSTFDDTDGDGLPDTRLPDFENPAQGLTGGIISGDDFAIPVLLNALESDSRANILSIPSVIVNNNVTATVSTEESRPTIESNQGNSSTSTSSGEPRNAGITLSISPTISPNNYLRLNVNLSISRFVGAFDPNSPTGGGITLSRSVTTQVTMPSDDTMVLGGIIEDQESDVVTGVPFLKDIPLLGILFSTNSHTKDRTNLYFFITPRILDEDDFSDLWQISLERKMQAEQYIGTRRLQIVDRKWTGNGQTGTPDSVEDADVNALDRNASLETPHYDRTFGKAQAPTGPAMPDQNRKN